MHKESSVPIDEIHFLPKIIRNALKNSGIEFLRSFQLKGIQAGIDGDNLVISAPTGSGKTLIAEIIAVYNAIKEHTKSLFLVPYKALAEEMKNTLSGRYPFVKIEIATGDYKEKPINLLGVNTDILIVTYEKADMIRREKPRWLKDVKVIIIDEIHLLGEGKRGALLDVVVTKFKSLNKQIITLSATIPNADEIANWLDAKLIWSNFRPVKLLEGIYLSKENRIYFYDSESTEFKRDLTSGKIAIKNEIIVEKDDSLRQSFLEEFVTAKDLLDMRKNIEILNVNVFRRGDLKEEFEEDELSKQLIDYFYSKLGKGKIFSKKIIKAKHNKRGFLGYIIDLTYDLLKKSKKFGTKWQVLIFRKSRSLAQKTAVEIAKFLEKSELSSLLFPESKNIAKELTSAVEETSPLTELLSWLLERGVAFHHAGLTKEERNIVETAFLTRKIGVIVATPTLAAGINLPARRVIVEHITYDPMLGRSEFISVAQFKQRGGRAGRPGLDSIGEAILIASNERDLITLFDTFIFGKVPIVTSYLGYDFSVLREQTLAFIASEKRDKPTIQRLLKFFNETFFSWKRSKESSDSAYLFLDNIIKSLTDLLKWDFVRAYNSKGKLVKHISANFNGYFRPTRVGEKISKLYLDPLSAVELIDGLRKIKEILHLKSITDKILASVIFYSISKTPDISNLKYKVLYKLHKFAQLINKISFNFLDLLKYIYEDTFFIDLFEAILNGANLSLSFEEEEELSSIGIMIILFLWINNVPMKEILQPISPSFGGGDLLELIRVTEWLLYCAKEIALPLKMGSKVVNLIDNIRLRVAYGVDNSLLPLVKIPGIGRSRAMILKKHGFDSIEKLSKATIKELVKIPGIGRTIAENIIRFTKGQIA